MKRILLIAFLCFTALQGFSQKNIFPGDIDYIYKPTIIGLYGGIGLATKNNHDVAPSLGLNFEMSSRTRSRIGAQLFYQQYSLYSDNELNSAKDKQGAEGEIFRHLSSYIFIAPKYSYMVVNKLNFITDISLNAGVGFKMTGFDTVQKWNHGYYTNGYYTNYSSGIGQYDSVIDASKNINSLLIRVGLTVTQYIHLGGGNWWFNLKEDFGFLANSLTKTGDVNVESPSRTVYSPTNIKPAYISLQIGISYIKSKKIK
jgi:hypothetical protein